MKKILCILLLSASMINGMYMARDGWRPEDRIDHRGDSFGDAVAVTTIVGLGGVALYCALRAPLMAAGQGLSLMHDGFTCGHDELFGDQCCLNPAINSMAHGATLLALASALPYGGLKLYRLVRNLEAMSN